MKLLGLKNIRNIYGLTMRDLAKRLNVTANAVNLWESGAVDAPEHRLTDLSRLLKIDKQLFLKENHDVKDLMLIEIARAEFKINEYKYLIKDDYKSIDEIIENNIANLTSKAKEEENNYYDIKDSLGKIVEFYSKISTNEYSKFNSFILGLDNILKDEIAWKKFLIIYNFLFDDKNNIGSSIKIENILKSQIIQNIDLLYKIYNDIT